MALDDLLKHIEFEAQKEIDKVIADGEKQLGEIVEKLNETKKQLLEAHAKKLEEEKKRELSNALTSARIKAKIELLDAKRKILDEFFKKLWCQILSLNIDSKKQIYEKLFSGITQSETAELVVSKKESAIWSGLKKQLSHSKFVESDAFSGGFIYKTTIATMDYTLENLFDSFRQTSEMAIAGEIFKNKHSTIP